MINENNEHYDTLKHILLGEEGLFIKTIQKNFSSLEIEDCNNFFQSAIKENEQILLEQSLYFVNLFIDLPEIQGLISSDSLSLDIVEHLILFSYGWAEVRNIPEDLALDNILRFLDQERLMELLLDSKVISRDRLLSYYILSKLDNKHIDLFFNKKEYSKDFLNDFFTLPEEVKKRILMKNSELFRFISLFFYKLENNEAEQFIVRYKTEIAEIEEMKSIVSTIRENVNLDDELNHPLINRDMERLAYVVKKLNNMNNVITILNSLTHEGIIDKDEKGLVNEILSNPLFRDVLHKYSKNRNRFENKRSDVTYF